MAHPGGRPSKYDPSFVDEVDIYIATKGKYQTSLPTKQGFALHIGVDDDTLDNWANAKDEKGELLHPEFFGALKHLKDLQAEQLVNDGIYGGKEVNGPAKASPPVFLLNQSPQHTADFLYGLGRVLRVRGLGGGKAVAGDQPLTEGLDFRPVSF